MGSRQYNLCMVNPNYDEDEQGVETLELQVVGADELRALQAGVKFARKLYGEGLQVHDKHLKAFPELAELNSTANSE